MKNVKNSPALLAFAVLAIVALSSCNRSSGCPYDFSIVENIIENAFSVVALVISFL